MTWLAISARPWREGEVPETLAASLAAFTLEDAAEDDGDGGGRGLHSSTSQLNLSRFLTQSTP